MSSKHSSKPVTPEPASKFELLTWAPPTSARGFSSSATEWATPAAGLFNYSESPESPESFEARSAKLVAQGTRPLGVNLGQQAQTWSTPTTRNDTGPSATKARMAEQGAADLQTQVSKWPTPATRDSKGANGPEHLAKERGHHDQLPNAVALWRGPRDLVISMAGASTSPSEGPLRLNPAFVEALMGWPAGWSMPGIFGLIASDSGQLGLEPTPFEFIKKLVEIFREVRRVLRPDGTCWVNLGDTYASAGWGGGVGGMATINGSDQQASRAARSKLRNRVVGVKPKDKLGIPWRVAFALQDDGWWLRSDIIWWKSNPMPESVRDRPTVAHEFVFLLSRSEKYFYNDTDAREECQPGAAHPRRSAKTIAAASAARAFTRKRDTDHARDQGVYTAKEAEERLESGKGAASKRMGREPGWRGKVKNNASFEEAVALPVTMRNWRDVWKIPTQPSKLEHFAAFPEELARRCIVAGSRPGDTVLDPFAGTCTTGLVALKEGRRFVGVELNPEYALMGHKRCAITPNLWSVSR
ncbi:MAG: site-specific DNA-methyltransferase [Archangium sp.]|nr:site-specific DNA-methyltransferase [Archangium sp.]